MLYFSFLYENDGIPPIEEPQQIPPDNQQPQNTQPVQPPAPQPAPVSTQSQPPVQQPTAPNPVTNTQPPAGQPAPQPVVNQQPQQPNTQGSWMDKAQNQFQSAWTGVKEFGGQIADKAGEVWNQTKEKFGSSTPQPQSNDQPQQPTTGTQSTPPANSQQQQVNAGNTQPQNNNQLPSAGSGYVSPANQPENQLMYDVLKRKPIDPMNYKTHEEFMSALAKEKDDITRAWAQHTKGVGGDVNSGFSLNPWSNQRLLRDRLSAIESLQSKYQNDEAQFNHDFHGGAAPTTGQKFVTGVQNNWGKILGGSALAAGAIAGKRYLDRRKQQQSQIGPFIKSNFNQNRFSYQ